MTEVLEAARTRYISEYDTFVEAAKIVKTKLRATCQRAGVRVDVVAREKDVASFVKKIVTKSEYRDDPWGKTTDKVGARVIVETKGDLARVVEAIRASDLEIIGPIDDKRLCDEPTALVYPGTHFQVRVPALTEKDGSPIECEVQVRTKAEDLWSVPSHKLTYKAPVEVSRLTQRRIWRLSVLVEMFDEEVETAMAEVASLPGYESARLLDIAESVYLTFVVERGDRELSNDVITALGNVVLPANPDDYAAKLHSFGDLHRAKLIQIYEDFGCRSAWAGDLDYWFFSQPESIVIFHKIESDVAGLRAWMVGSDLFSAVVPLLEAWGVPAVVEASQPRSVSQI